MSIKADTLSLSRGKGEVAQFCAYLDDEDSRAIVEQVVRDLIIPHAVVSNGTIYTAIKALSQKRSPRTLLVDLSRSELPLSDINELADVCEPGVTVIAIGDRNDVGLFRELLSCGVRDYLVKPLSPALVQRALLASADNGELSRHTTRLGRFIVTIGTRGGVGATMVATSTAWSIANRRRRRAALLDLDLQFGSVALALDLEPTHSLREALESNSHIDSLYVDRAMIHHSESLYVLSSEEDLSSDLHIKLDSTKSLISELRRKFHYTIVDLPRNMSSISNFILSNATHLIIVTDLSLAGMRDTLRIAQTVLNTNAACQIVVVGNRTGEFRHGEISTSEFEKAINRKIDLRIPFDPKNTMTAINIGKPVSSYSGIISSKIDDLINIISGIKQDEKKGIFYFFSMRGK